MVAAKLALGGGLAMVSDFAPMLPMFPRIFPVWICAVSLAAAADPLATIDFNRDIQPILSENCYHCHGPDSAERKGKLRLDQKEGPDGAYRTIDGITAIKPGDSAGSEVIARIFSTDRDEVMPPPKSNRRLTDAQKELLKRWVDDGANWGAHWAFVPPVRPGVPEIEDPQLAGWAKNPIDRFVVKRLLAEGLRPSPEAESEKLVRRLTLELTGLPPTLEEVDAFVADYAKDADGAVSRLVDRLLAHPRFGERMVWEWLEAARYADTNGYQGDPTRPMWYWRDWAIAALNANMPYDQFTMLQLAGDLFPKDAEFPKHWIAQGERDRLIATGFHRDHMINGEGGRIPEESRVEYVFDRVETTGTVWMGLTLNCCRCHDHKYDPISQREYYQLSAFFNSIDESGMPDAGGGLGNPVISLATPEQEAKLAELRKAEEETKNAYTELEKTLREEQPAWEATMREGGDQQREPRWHLLKPYELFAEHGTQLKVLEDGSVCAEGPSPETDEYVFIANSEIGDLTGFKLEAVLDDSLKNKGPGRAPDYGNFVLSEIELQGSGRPVELGIVSADFSQKGWDAKGATDGNLKTGWAVFPEYGKPHQLIIEARSQVGYGPKVLLSFRLRFHYGKQHTLGRFKLYATADSPALLRPMPEKLRAILMKPADQRSEAESKELTKYYLDTNPQLTAARDRREAAKNARQTEERKLPRTMVMREREKPRDTHILIKGAYDKYGEKVTHGLIHKVGAAPAEPPRDRLALAKWLMSDAHPLTARVTVNRLWQQVFGIGLVKSVDDFGVQGDKPTHPELLDWLAVEFRESGWDVKRLLKLIVTSATYRQSTKVSPDLVERDPENKLLARGPRMRWPSWMIRDQALAVSGLLVEKVGGPPVKGYQPPGVWEEATFGQIRYTQDKGEALYRRSLYTFWRRIVGPTMFFDVSNRQNCSVKSTRTNTPLHALTTMNDVTYVEAARALAQRIVKSETASDDTARLAQIFRLCTARAAKTAELDVLKRRLDLLRSHYGDDVESAKKLVSVGESKPADDIAPQELAAWSGVALLVLNLDEVITKE